MRKALATAVFLAMAGCHTPAPAMDGGSVYAALNTEPSTPAPRAKKGRNKAGHRVTTGGVASIVRAAAVRHGIPPAWYLAKVHVESRFNCRAVSPAGAMGIGQVMPATARSMGYSPRSMFDCYTGADAGARYAALAYRKAGGNLMYASTMYLTGIYSGRRTSAYGASVISAMRNF